MTRRLLVLGLLAAAVAGNAGAVSTSGTTVRLGKTKLGSVLADSRGHTLYLFEADRAGKSTCYARCATFWPPLLTVGAPRGASGVGASLLGTVERRDGKLQVTYAHHPLYLFAKDKRAGQTAGEDLKAFGAGWYVVSAAGKKIEPDAGKTATTTTSTTTTSGGGYGGGGGDYTP